MIAPEYRYNQQKPSVTQTLPAPVLSRRESLRGLIMAVGLACAPMAHADQLSTQDLKHQCRPLLEGSRSLMSAFQSGQCSSYILGIYDLVAQQCPQLKIRRDQAVRSTLEHLNQLPDNQAPAVQTIDRFLSGQSSCLPVASL